MKEKNKCGNEFSFLLFCGTDLLAIRGMLLMLLVVELVNEVRLPAGGPPWLDPRTVHLINLEGGLSASMDDRALKLTSSKLKPLVSGMAKYT
jgi:hypothetical protein